MENFWLSPNTEKDDLYLSLKLLLRHWGRREDISAPPKLRKELAEFLGVDQKQIFLFNSGRAALTVLLRAKGIKPGDKVALQAYTCRAAVEPVLSMGAQPIYLDIDSSWNMDPLWLEKRLKEEKINLVIVQHTFGIPAQIDKIREICRKHDLPLVEDCTHSLGGEYQGKKLGLWGDFAYFSFGRDKVISSVFGGALLVNQKGLLKKVIIEAKKLTPSSRAWISQQLLHPLILGWLVLPLYNFYSIGRIILYLSQKLHLLSKANPAPRPAPLPPPLAALARQQLKKISLYNQHRKELAAFYSQALTKEKIKRQKLFPAAAPVWLRFGIMTEKAALIQERLFGEKIWLDRWLGTAVGPEDTRPEEVGYRPGSCPRAEELAKKELQFPTGIRIKKKEAEKMVKFFLKEKERLDD